MDACTIDLGDAVRVRVRVSASLCLRAHLVAVSTLHVGRSREQHDVYAHGFVLGLHLHQLQVLCLGQDCLRQRDVVGGLPATNQMQVRAKCSDKIQGGGEGVGKVA